MDSPLSALHASSDRLHDLTAGMDDARLTSPSYCDDWSIAQVLSHLGSQAEVFGLWLDAGLSGQDPPDREAFPPIWDAWNSRSPQAQAAASLQANEALIERFESLDAGQRERFRLAMFGMDLDLAGLLRMRLGEHAVHTWDVAVALDPAATVAPDAVVLLVDTLGQLAARAGRPDGVKRRVRVSTSSPQREFLLESGEAVTLVPFPDDGRDESLAELRLPAEAFVRLTYGRLDPAHTPAIEAQGVDLAELRPIFPGF